MTIMERSGNKFEKAWKDLFEGAEVQPREDLWTKIDSALANRQIRRYRRKILIYKLLAAASILFAIGIGYFSAQDFFRSQGSTDHLSSFQVNPENQPGIRTEIPPEVDQDLKNDDAPISEMDKIEEGNTTITKQTSRETEGELSLAEYESNADASKISNQINITALDQSNREREIDFLPYLSSRLNVEPIQPADNLPGPQKKKDPYADDWFALYEKTRIHNQEGEDPSEFWAGVNFSSGVFDPNISYGTNSGVLADQANLPGGSSSYDKLTMVSDPGNNIANYMKATRPEETSYNPEFSYAYGVNVGYQISPKFMIKGGLAYLSNHTSTKINSYINNVITNRKMPNQALYSVTIESAGVNSVNTTTDEIKLNNTYEFISLPVSFGYYIIDKKIEWMLTAGFTTDFFLKNTISDPSNFLEPKEITAGSDSPYNNSYLNGTLGTMINVSFADHYRFSFEPTYRMGLSEFAKDDAAFTSRPSAFFITAGLSYIFR